MESPLNEQEVAPELFQDSVDYFKRSVVYLSSLDIYRMGINGFAYEENALTQSYAICLGHSYCILISRKSGVVAEMHVLEVLDGMTKLSCNYFLHEDGRFEKTVHIYKNGEHTFLNAADPLKFADDEESRKEHITPDELHQLNKILFRIIKGG